MMKKNYIIHYAWKILYISKKIGTLGVETMKRSFLLALCLSAAAAFAGAYDIGDFSAKDAVTADNQYFAPNNGEPLKTATVDEASNIPSGSLVLRQKFTDSEGLNVYQLYIGQIKDISSMTALSVPVGTSYSDVIKAKLYERRGMKPGDDIEKVYFDGKSVYIPGLTSALAFVNGAPIDLSADAAASDTKSAAPKKECDEFDVSCDEDIQALKNKNDQIDVTGDLNKSNAQADAYSYSANEAAQDVKDRFGIADEVRFWSAVALSAVAAGGAVMGIYQHMKSSEANDAYNKLKNVSDAVEDKIKTACGESSNVTNKDACYKFYKETTLNAFMFENWTYVDLQNRMKTNKDTKDSYGMFRNIWFGVTLVSLTTAIVLFTW